MKKHLKGFMKKYFKLSYIAMYSTINSICTTQINFQYHIKEFKFPHKSQAPPK